MRIFKFYFFKIINASVYVDVYSFIGDEIFILNLSNCKGLY